jgi:hypothetical protein
LDDSLTGYSSSLSRAKAHEYFNGTPAVGEAKVVQGFSPRNQHWPSADESLISTITG